MVDVPCLPPFHATSPPFNVLKFIIHTIDTCVNYNVQCIKVLFLCFMCYDISMNSKCNNCGKCNLCTRKKCDCDLAFDINRTPEGCFLFTIGTEQKKICFPEEHLTKLSGDKVLRTLTYLDEHGDYTDIPYGDLAGKLGDLVDVEDTPGGNCAFLIKRSGDVCAECNEGATDMWHKWMPLENKTDSLQHVMGINTTGCPELLDVPMNVNEYWYGMWRPGKGFSYVQPTPVDEIPVDDNGNPIVISQDPDTKEPVVGTLPDTTNKVLELMHRKICTTIVGINGFTVSNGTGIACFYGANDTMNLIMDVHQNNGRTAQNITDLLVAQIEDPDFWPDMPDTGWADLPMHCSWVSNSGGGLNLVRSRINNKGQIAISGTWGAGASGRSMWVLDGVDDNVAWPPKANLVTRWRNAQ